MHFRRVLGSCEIAGIAGRGPVGALPWRIGGRAQGVRAQGGGNSSPCGPTVGAPRNDPNKREAQYDCSRSLSCTVQEYLQALVQRLVENGA